MKFLAVKHLKSLKSLDAHESSLSETLYSVKNTEWKPNRNFPFVNLLTLNIYISAIFNWITLFWVKCDNITGRGTGVF